MISEEMAFKNFLQNKIDEKDQTLRNYDERCRERENSCMNMYGIYASPAEKLDDLYRDACNSLLYLYIKGNSIDWLLQNAQSDYDNNPEDYVSKYKIEIIRKFRERNNMVSR